MTTNQASFPAPATGLFPAIPAVARNVLLAVVGSLILWASAKVQVPFWPVPMTMQTGVVLLIGALYGWRLGAATVVLYLAQGAIGWPVFAGTPERGIGLAYMVGPTGGYLLGFVLAAALAGWVLERTRDVATVVLGLTAAMLVIYACGFAWLAPMIGAGKAFTAGIVPFVLGDVVKIALAAAIVLGVVRTARG